MDRAKLFDTLFNNNCIDWFEVEHRIHLFPEKFIRDNAEHLNWENISSAYDFTEQHLTQYADLLDWDYVTGCQPDHQPNGHFSQDFLRQHIDKLNWNTYTAKEHPIDDDIMVEIQLKGYLEYKKPRLRAGGGLTSWAIRPGVSPRGCGGNVK